MASKNVGGVYGSVDIDTKGAIKSISALKKELATLNKEKRDLEAYQSSGKSYLNQLKQERKELEEQRKDVAKLAQEQKKAYQAAKGTDSAPDLQKQYKKTLSQANSMKKKVEELDRRLTTLNYNKSTTALEASFKNLEERIASTSLAIAKLKQEAGQGVEILKGNKAQGDLNKLKQAEQEARKLAVGYEQVKANADLLTPTLEAAMNKAGYFKSDIARDWLDADSLKSEVDACLQQGFRLSKESRTIRQSLAADIAKTVGAVGEEFKDIETILDVPTKSVDKLIAELENSIEKDNYGRQRKASDVELQTKLYGPYIERLKQTKARYEEIRAIANSDMYESQVRGLQNTSAKAAVALQRMQALKAGVEGLNKVIENASTKSKMKDLLSLEEADANFAKKDGIDDYQQKRLYAARRWMEQLAGNSAQMKQLLDSEASTVNKSADKVVQAEAKKASSVKEQTERTIAELNRRKAAREAARLAEQQAYEAYEKNKLSSKQDTTVVSPTEGIAEDAKQASIGIIELENNINLLTKAMANAMLKKGYFLSDITSNRLGTENIKQLASDMEIVGDKAKKVELELQQMASALNSSFNLKDFATKGLIDDSLLNNDEFMAKAKYAKTLYRVYDTLNRRIAAVKSGIRGLHKIIQQASTSNNKQLADISAVEQYEKSFNAAFERITAKQKQIKNSSSTESSQVVEVTVADNTSAINNNTEAHNRETKAIIDKNKALEKSKELSKETSTQEDVVKETTEQTETTAPVVSKEDIALIQQATSKMKELSNIKLNINDLPMSKLANSIDMNTTKAKMLKQYIDNLIPKYSELQEAQSGSSGTGSAGQLAPINQEINRIMAMFRAACEGYDSVVKSALMSNIEATRSWLQYTRNIADYMKVIRAYASGDMSLLNTPDLIRANEALKQMIASLAAGESAVKALGVSYDTVTQDLIMSLMNVAQQAKLVQDRLLQVQSIGDVNVSISSSASGLDDEAARANYAAQSAAYARQYMAELQRLEGVKMITAGMRTDTEGMADAAKAFSSAANQTRPSFDTANATVFRSSVETIDVEFESVNRRTSKLRTNIRNLLKDVRKIVAPIRNIPEQIERATSETYGMKNGFKDIANIVQGIVISQTFYAGLAKVKNTVTDIVDAFKETEAASIAFGTMFSQMDTGDKYVKMLQDFAAVTPFSFTEVVSNSRMLAAYGFQAKQILPIMTKLSDAAAATGDATSFERVARAIGQIRTKGRLLGEEVRQLHEAGINASEILQEELGLTADQMANIGDLKIPAETAITALLKGIEKRFGGASEALSESLKGILGTISDNIKLIGMNISKGAFESYKTFLTGIRDSLLAAQAEMSKTGFGGWLEKSFSPETVGIIRNLVANFNLMWQSFKAVWIALAPIGKEFLRLVAILSNMVTPVIATIVRVVYGLVHILTQSTPLVRLFVQTIGTLMIAVTVAKAVTLLRNAIAGLAVTRAVTAVLKGVGSAIKALGLAIMSNPWWLLLVVAGGAMAYFAAKSDLLAKASNKLSGLFNNMWDNSPTDYFKPEVEDTTDVMENFSNTAGTMADSLEDVEDSAKKARDAVASFDEVFTLPDETGSDLDVDFGELTGSLDDYLDGIEIPSVDIPVGFEKPDFKFFSDEIVANLKNALIGAGIGAVLGGVLGGIFGNPLLGAQIGAAAGALIGFFWDSMTTELQNGIKGAGVGAALGAAIGFIFGQPIIGAAIGAAAGAIGGYFWDSLSDEMQNSVKAAGVGAGIGAVIGTFIAPGIGTAIGAAIGAAVTGVGVYIIQLKGFADTAIAVISGIGESVYGVLSIVRLALDSVVWFFEALAESVRSLVKGDLEGAVNAWKTFGAKMSAGWTQAWSDITAATSRGILAAKNTTAAGTKELVDTFDIALQSLPKLTEENTTTMAALFTQNLRSLDNDAITILRGTSDSMNILFNGIKADMTDEEAMKQFAKNLDTMRLNGMTSVDLLESDFSAAMEQISSKTITYADVMEKAATEIFKTLKDNAKNTTSEMATAVLENVSAMDSSTVAGLISMGGSWSQIFEGITADADFNSDDTKNKVIANLEKMRADGTLNVDNMRTELGTILDEMNAKSNLQIEQFKNFITNGTMDTSVMAGTNAELIKDNIYRALSQVPGLTATEMNSMAGKIVDKLVETGTLSSTQAGKIKDSIITQLGKTPGEAQTKLDELAKKFTDKSFKELTTDAGANIGKGFADGIKNALADFLWNDRWWGKLGNWIAGKFKSSVPEVSVPVTASVNTKSGNNARSVGTPDYSAYAATPMTMASYMDEISTASINTRAIPSARAVVSPSLDASARTSSNAARTSYGVQSSENISRADIEAAVITAVNSVMENMPTPVYAGTLIADERSLRQLSQKIRVVENSDKRRRVL